MTVIPFVIGGRYVHQRIDTETEGFGNKRTSGDHSNYSIVEIGQNTKKSPRETWCQSDLYGKISGNTGLKNSQMSKIIIKIIIITSEYWKRTPSNKRR